VTGVRGRITTRANRRRAIGLAAAVAAAVLCVGITQAPAAKRSNSFDGSCSVKGTATFSPPATNVQQPLTTRYYGTGTCSGTLNGRQVTNAPMTMRSVARANGSCPLAETIRPGRGSIRFAGGTTIRYRLEFRSVLTEVSMTFRGERSGSARGRGTFLNDRTPPDVSEQCAGDGLERTALDIVLATESPLVSKRRGR
jgi:hypothetical protein